MLYGSLILIQRLSTWTVGQEKKSLKIQVVFDIPFVLFNPYPQLEKVQIIFCMFPD